MGCRRRLPRPWCAALERLAADTHTNPETYAAELLEIALLEKFKEQYGETVTEWLLREPAALDPRRGASPPASAHAAEPAGVPPTFSEPLPYRRSTHA